MKDIIKLCLYRGFTMGWVQELFRKVKFLGTVSFVLLIACSNQAHSIEDEEFDRIFGMETHTEKEFSFNPPWYRKRDDGNNKILAKVDLSEQKMKVFINDRLWQEWKVSSGARGYSTPTGKYKPFRMHEEWFSRKYDNTPMPHSIFFYKGYAVHATDYIRNLGRPASHGCVRLHPEHAKAFFKLVQEFGMKKTHIVINQ